MVLRQDWHIHTHRSLCGKAENTVEAIVAELDRKDMVMAGLADHIDIPQQRDWFISVLRGNRLDLDSVTSRCRVFVGAEVTMLSPTKCALHRELAAELDFVLVACNHYHLEDVEKPRRQTPKAFAHHYLDMVLGATQLGFASSVSHPFFHSNLGPEKASATLKHYDENRLADVLSEAAKADMAFEINPFRARFAAEWFRDFVLEARRFGVKFTLGSDAHTLPPIGFGDGNSADMAVALCQRIGLTAADLKWLPRGKDRGQRSPDWSSVGSKAKA